MDRIAVFVDDADHARHVLEPMMATGGSAPTQWVLVACAPRLTHRIGKWVAHSTREQWRERWAARLREQMAPLVDGRPGCEVQWMLARRPLPEMTRELRLRLGAGLPVLDARRPKLGQTMAPVDPASQEATQADWKGPVAVSGSLSIMLALTD